MRNSFIFSFRPNANIKHHITSGSSQSPTLTQSSPNSPDDINSSLLRPSSDVENNYIFGKFKGFTLKPLPDANLSIANSNSPKVAFVHPVAKSGKTIGVHVVPSREAPPPPVPKHGINAKIEKFNNISATISPPALPPLNKGSTARPIISNPILETSTCDAKELPNVVKYPTIRPAPTPPKEPKVVKQEEPIAPEVLINPMSVTEKKLKNGTLSRIQSFLKNDAISKSDKVQKQLKSIDKDKLKDLQISSPILINEMPLNDIDSSNDENKKAKINRAQSMRDPPSPPIVKPLNSFGSMRNGNPRPKSIVDRPTIPPPPRPSAIVITSPNYQNTSESAKSSSSSNEYDDCETREPGTPDNIYSVIEESPASPDNIKQQGSIESMGLLGEIVNEIEHRNIDSVYIASTLKRNKNPDEKFEPADNDYSVDSSASTTSSGYMRPISSTPVARIPPSKTIAKIPSTTSSNSTSSFKSAKSETSSCEPTAVKSPQEVKPIKFNGPLKRVNSDGGKKTTLKEPESVYKTPTSNKPLIDKQEPVRKLSLKNTVTPPSITVPKKNTPGQATAVNTKVASQPKPFQKPGNTFSNLKSSSASSQSANKITPKEAAKINGAPKNTSSANKVLSTVASKKSNVASLQQKFENPS